MNIGASDISKWQHSQKIKLLTAYSAYNVFRALYDASQLTGFQQKWLHTEKTA